ncbi:hypothetical protein PUN28_008490 [Cardiocondyla obscurior]|uniref:Uncharacterized protein n=1 Tax=Cardiocondyla obscurior TaxID=286306 RepID=A0AAW2FZY1_9HYME
MPRRDHSRGIKANVNDRSASADFSRRGTARVVPRVCSPGVKCRVEIQRLGSTVSGSAKSPRGRSKKSIHRVIIQHHQFHRVDRLGRERERVPTITSRYAITTL